MTSLVLIRHSYAPYGTYGQMFLGDQMLWTVEQPWRLNMRQHSCVPEGRYQIIHHSSTKYPVALALINPELNVYYQPGPGVPETGRKAILIHPANVPADLAGCIATGTDIGFMRGTLAVVNSRTALGKVIDFVNQHSITSLVISSVDPHYSVDDIAQHAQELSV